MPHQKQVFKIYLNRWKWIAIGNTIFNLPCINDLKHSFTKMDAVNHRINHFILYTYWDLHTEKPQSKFSFANRCKPIKCRVSLFPHVRKAIRPIRSRVSCFFTCEPYGKWKFSFKAGWRGFVHRTSHRFASAECREQIVFIRIILLLFKAKVVSLKQKGGGKEFELRSQTPTKQPWTQISQLYFINFGFYFTSFAFYEAAFFQWLLFDHICLNKACHNLRRVFNLSMYITNK